VLFAELYATVAATTVLLELRNTMVLALTVAALSASLNVIVIAAFVATFVAPLAGLKPVTVGGVVSAGATVVNVEVALAASGVPATSVTPPVPPLTVIV